MKRLFLLFLFALLGSAEADIYTKPKAGAGGGIQGKVDAAITHAIALERDRKSCYKGAVGDGGKSFVFNGLPTGKYDLLLFTEDRVLMEGVFLGEPAEAAVKPSMKNLEERIEKADSFFNKYKLHRFGLIDEGAKLLAVVERMRDKETLTGGGEVLKGPVRRFEIAEFDKAADTWSFMVNRHLYREQDGPEQTAFFESRHVAALGGIRVIDSLKDIGSVAGSR